MPPDVVPKPVAPSPQPVGTPSLQVAPQGTTIKKSYGKTIGIIILIVLLVFSLAVNISQYFNLPWLNLKASKYSDFEIDPHNKAIIRYGMSYYLSGTITDVKKNGDEIEILTNIQGLPRAFVTYQTNVLTKTNNKFINVSRDQIQPGKRVELLMFQLELKDWALMRVVLLP